MVQLGISAIQAFTFVLIGNSITGIRGMWFEYWLVLFTCWAGANLLGLLISDSFKAVVTIYILIPFLVIPQIILSGIMVKFEKLNPSIPMTNPIEIPFYGEFISARWGYEALAVKQFKDNKFERQFYVYDKAMSKARYQKDYWYSSVKGNIDFLRNELERKTRNDDFNDKLLFVYNEIKKELLITPAVKFDYAESLTPEKITPEIVAAAAAYVEVIKHYYVEYSNKARDRKELLMEKLRSQDPDGFLKLKFNYTNESLEEFVTNDNEIVKTIEFKNELFQKLDPIYMDPRSNFIKAHFYAPEKKVFGYSFPTFVVNVVILWIMTILIYIALYFRLLKKLLDSGEVAMGRKFRGAD
jgi:hypothetical protein